MMQTHQSSNSQTTNKRLTLKQKRFVDSYIRNGGDGARAVVT